MPLSSQEDHARQSEIHKNKNGAYINMHSLSPPPPTHHQPGDWIILSALPKSFKGYQQTVILTLHKAIWGRVSAANEWVPLCQKLSRK